MPAELFSVRPGLAEDVQCFTDIERCAAHSPWSLNQFLSSSLREHEASLALVSPHAVIVGFCVYQQLLDEVTLMNIAVHPDQQGQGCASQLLDALLSLLVKAGTTRCLLEVRRGNTAAIALYRKFGFVDDGVRKDYYPGVDGREDALLMSCELVREQ